MNSKRWIYKKLIPCRGGKAGGLGPDVAAICSKWSCKACTTLSGIRTVEQPLPDQITCNCLGESEKLVTSVRESIFIIDVLLY